MTTFILCSTSTSVRPVSSFFFSSRRRHTRFDCDWSSDVCSSDLNPEFVEWMMGFPPGWTEGHSRDARLRMLGNAVVPAVAALAWRELSATISDGSRSEEHTSELQSQSNLVCRLLLEKKKQHAHSIDLHQDDVREVPLEVHVENSVEGTRLTCTRGLPFE